MATGYEPYSTKDQELKTQFSTREGIYRLMAIGIRPKTGLYGNGNPNTPVRVSFVEPVKQSHASIDSEESLAKNDVKLQNGSEDSQEQLYANVEKICYNTGKELYVHPDIRSHRVSKISCFLHQHMRKMVEAFTFFESLGSNRFTNHNR